MKHFSQAKGITTVNICLSCYFGAKVMGYVALLCIKGNTKQILV